MSENGSIMVEAAVYAHRATMLNVKVGDVIVNLTEEVRGGGDQGADHGRFPGPGSPGKSTGSTSLRPSSRRGRR